MTSTRSHRGSAPNPGSQARIFNVPIVALLTGYKRFVSPFIPPACRFEPTCSVYARDCFQHLSFARALWLSLRRLSRCHPFHKGGFDPAPIEDP